MLQMFEKTTFDTVLTGEARLLFEALVFQHPPIARLCQAAYTETQNQRQNKEGSLPWAFLSLPMKKPRNALRFRG